MAHLVEGQELRLIEGTLSLPKGSYGASVVKVDYFMRKLWLDGALPKGIVGLQIEIGNDDRHTAFKIASHAVEGGKSIITFEKAADLSYARVINLDERRNRVVVNVVPVETQLAGTQAGLTVSNEDGTRTWPATALGKITPDGYSYGLQGKFTEKDIPVGSTLRVWEYGPGDKARLPASAVVRRGEDGKLIVESFFGAKWTARRR
jgi:hypothetical protein